MCTACISNWRSIEQVDYLKIFLLQLSSEVYGIAERTKKNRNVNIQKNEISFSIHFSLRIQNKIDFSFSYYSDTHTHMSILRSVFIANYDEKCYLRKLMASQTHPIEWI